MQTIKYVFQQHGDDRGQLVALEEGRDIPFEIKRVYYMYATGEGVHREKIAAEKAGILKKGTVAVLGKMEKSARDVIEAKADSLDVKTVNVDNLLTKISTWNRLLIIDNTIGTAL